MSETPAHMLNVMLTTHNMQQLRGRGCRVTEQLCQWKASWTGFYVSSFFCKPFAGFEMKQICVEVFARHVENPCKIGAQTVSWMTLVVDYLVMFSDVCTTVHQIHFWFSLQRFLKVISLTYCLSSCSFRSYWFFQFEAATVKATFVFLFCSEFSWGFSIIHLLCSFGYSQACDGFLFLHFFLYFPINRYKYKIPPSRIFSVKCWRFVGL